MKDTIQQQKEKLLSISEKLNDPYAQFLLGKHYEEEQNISKAIYWYIRSNQQRNYASQNLNLLKRKYPKKYKDVVNQYYRGEDTV